MIRSILLGVVLMSLALAAPAPAIVGGEPAREEYPFFAQLLRGGDSWCGASLVRERWLLTAAHCVVGDEPGRFEAILGSHERTVGRRIGVVSLKVHPGFQESVPVLKAAWDVAVVELEEAPDAPVIAFAEPAQFTPGAAAIAIGFGADGFAVGDYRDRLYQADMPIVDDEECGRVYAGRFDARQHICAGTFENESNTCQGDSGGPMIVRDGAGAWRLVGTTSFGIGCGTPGTYNVYARAAGPDLRAWIEKQLPPPAPALLPPAPAQPAPAPATPPSSAPPTSSAPSSAACRRARTAVRTARRRVRAARGRPARARAQRRLASARRTAARRCST